jgi:hypothetical protein
MTQLSTNLNDILHSRLGIGLKFQCRTLGAPRLLPGGWSALFRSSLFAVYLMVLAFELSVRKSGGRDAVLCTRAGDLYGFPLISTAAAPLQSLNLFFISLFFFLCLFELLAVQLSLIFQAAINRIHHLSHYSFVVFGQEKKSF